MSQEKIGRNDKCHCGSGRKYKHCCLEKDETEAREARAKAAEEAAAAQPAAEEPVGHPVYPGKGHATEQPWKRGASINTHGFRKTGTTRKVGSG